MRLPPPQRFRCAPRRPRATGKTCTPSGLTKPRVDAPPGAGARSVTEGQGGLDSILPRSKSPLLQIQELSSMNATAANQRADRIEVVDDDARKRHLLRRYLPQEGLEVLLAEDAKALN